MFLTNENYFSKESAKEYLSVSQYKSFVGTPIKRGCEERTLAEMNGFWTKDSTTAMLASSYVDAHFEGTLDVFLGQHPEAYTKGTKNNPSRIRSEYMYMDDIIARIERDPYMMKYLAGEKQVIFTGEIFGAKWKGKIDSLIRHVCIVDLKVMKSLRDHVWSRELGRVDFCVAYGYDVQGAIYQRLTEINTGKKLPFYIAAASKEKYPEIEIIAFEQDELDTAMREVEMNVERILDLKAGKADPERCFLCDYCHATKKLSVPVHHSDLIQSANQ